MGGGRTWWAHFEFTRINIEPIILRKKIEEMREAHTIYRRASYSAAANANYVASGFRSVAGAPLKTSMITPRWRSVGR